MKKKRRDKKRMSRYLRNKKNDEIGSDPSTVLMNNSKCKQKRYLVVFPQSIRARPEWRLNGHYMKGDRPIFTGYRISDNTKMTQ